MVMGCNYTVISDSIEISALSLVLRSLLSAPDQHQPTSISWDWTGTLCLVASPWLLQDHLPLNKNVCSLSKLSDHQSWEFIPVYSPTTQPYRKVVHSNGVLMGSARQPVSQNILQSPFIVLDSDLWFVNTRYRDGGISQQSYGLPLWNKHKSY